MFNPFQRKTAKDFMEDAKETYGLPDTTQVPPMPEVKPPKDECLYTVGTTQSGKTVLKVGDGYGTMTLIMNGPATRQMIRMLEATLTEEADDEEDI